MGYVVLIDEPMEYVVDLPDGRHMVAQHLVVPLPRHRKKRRRGKRRLERRVVTYPDREPASGPSLGVDP